MSIIHVLHKLNINAKSVKKIEEVSKASMSTSPPTRETQNMPLIDPIPLSQLSTDLQAAISSARACGVLSTPLPVQVWAHCPELASRWLSLLCAFYENSTLQDRTRELMRLKIAAVTNCPVCQLARKSDSVSEQDIACIELDDERFTPAEHAAMSYAHLFASNYQDIGVAEFNALRAHYSEPEIVEISMYCSMMLAGGRMTYVQRIT